MPIEWPFPRQLIRLGGTGEQRLESEDGARQQVTAQAILHSLKNQPGVILADEVGMGKTYVALAVAASALLATRGKAKPVIVMVPRGLARKWPREWRNFKKVCVTDPQALAWVRDRSVKNPTEFFQALSEPSSTRPHLIWMTTGCFSRGLNDPWIKLALVRLARSDTKMTSEVKSRLYKWAAMLTRLKTYRRLDPRRRRTAHERGCALTGATFSFGRVFSRRTPRIPFPGISGNIDTSSIGVSLTA